MMSFAGVTGERRMPTLGFYAQIHEIFRLLKVPMAYAQSIPAKIASKSIGLRLSLKA